MYGISDSIVLALLLQRRGSTLSLQWDPRSRVLVTWNFQRLSPMSRCMFTVDKAFLLQLTQFLPESNVRLNNTRTAHYGYCWIFLSNER